MKLLNYYIYYRVGDANFAALKVLIRELQAALLLQSGVSGKLLIKRDGADVWMEIYENVIDPIAFESALNKLIDEFKIAACLPPDQARKMECFYVSD